jgi:serine/threonine protein kinase/formylglycine-generating enzyme required for sulfatase activity
MSPNNSPCPSAEILRRSLDPDDPMTEQERQRIEAHVDHCDKSCKGMLEALLRGDILPFAPSGTQPGYSPGVFVAAGPHDAATLAGGAPAPSIRPPTLPGYDILEEIGRGGMGVVYKARQVGLNRLVAVKMILAGVYASSDGLGRFRTEAEAVASLQHPNIVQIHEIGENAGAPYFTLEYVEGGTLAQKLGGAPQPAQQAAETAETLARAVESAHRRGVVHRDLKPSNVLVAADGQLKITDFGLAKRLEEDAGHTRSGEILGTPSYMAPEQASGRPSEIGPACDVYALGAILYELLTGRPPFRGPTGLDTLMQVIHDDPVPPRQLQSKTPRDLETICLKCLEKDPQRRYARAADLADDLRRFQRHEPILARPVGPWTRAVKWARRRPAVAILFATVVISLIAGTVASTLFAVVANDRADQLEKSRKERAQAEVDALLTASPGEVPGILQNLLLDQKEVLPRLRELRNDQRLPERQRQRVALALLPVDSGQVDYLYDHLLDAEPDEVRVFVQQLSDHKGELIERLWTVLEQPGKDHEDRRLRAAAALAVYDPEGRRWDRAVGPVVQQLVEVDTAFLPAWMKALAPVRDKLVEPLTAVFRDRKEEHAAERFLATSILADYAADQPKTLADLLQDGDERQFAALFPRVEANPGPIAAALKETVGKALSTEKTEDDKEHLAKHQANAAVALLRLGQPEVVWPLLKHSRDPRVRSYLIHYLSPRLPPQGADAGAVVRRLDEEKDISIQRALLLILGEFSPEQLSAEERDRLVPKVLKLYRDDSDAGLHGAADWLLREWGKGDDLKKIDRVWAKDQKSREKKMEQIRKGLTEASDRREPADVGSHRASWYVNGQGQTMVVVPESGEPFLVGSPPREAGRENGPEGEEEKQVSKRIPRSFAVAAREVTVEQFLRFRKDHDYNKGYSPTPDCPVGRVTWFDAAAYCNWLTQQDLPEEEWKDQRCYLPNANGEYGDGMTLAPNYLERKGYRLPSEAEWEYACRAGAVTSRYYGETEELLGRYAWYMKNSLGRGMAPGAPGAPPSLKPNDLGLFDMLGNASEWCQDYRVVYEPGEDVEETTAKITNETMRMSRGSSFRSLFARSALRDKDQASNRYGEVGFRPARTLR